MDIRSLPKTYPDYLSISQISKDINSNRECFPYSTLIDNIETFPLVNYTIKQFTSRNGPNGPINSSWNIDIVSLFGYYRFLYNSTVESLINLGIVDSSRNLKCNFEILNQYILTKRSEKDYPLSEFFSNSDDIVSRFLLHNYSDAGDALELELLCLILYDREYRINMISNHYKWESTMPFFICLAVADNLATAIITAPLNGGKIYFNTRLAHNTSIGFDIKNMMEIKEYDMTLLDAKQYKALYHFKENYYEEISLTFKIDKKNPFDIFFWNLVEMGDYQMVKFYLNDDKFKKYSVGIVIE